MNPLAPHPVPARLPQESPRLNAETVRPVRCLDGWRPLRLSVVTRTILALGCCLSLALAAAESWRTALREQTDPAKLALLGRRGANPRVNRVLYYLHQAESAGVAPDVALAEAFQANSTTGLLAALALEVQLRNYQHAQCWGLLTAEGLGRLRRGEAPTITRGPYAGEKTDVDHIVPISWAPEAGNSMANLEIRPASWNRSKGNHIGWSDLRHAGRLRDAGVLSSPTLWWVRWAYWRGWLVPAGFGAVLLWVVKRRQKQPLGEMTWGFIQGLLQGAFRRISRGHRH